MGVFKEIPKADGSGITTFYRLDNDKDTVETTSTGGTETMIDYNKALNKPSINNVVLVGNKTLDELGIQPKGDYITEVPSEYITEEELNQKQYATESYVLDKIANIEHFSRQIVDELPLVGKDNVIYLVRKEGAGDDIYNEYIWTGTSYELFGSTATDLSDYYNKDSVNELLDTKVDKQEGKGLSTNDYTNADKSKLASLENYDDSELRAAIDSLHNYDDTEIRQEIDKLSNESEAMSEKIEDIDKTNDYKLEAVRLIKSGDYWIWKDSADNLIDYFKARDLLGTENCILIMEQLDSDGKSIPADYKIDGDRIRILYKDLENLNHEMYMGPPDKDEVEGIDIIIDNGAEATLFALGGDGKSEQVVTTGANLFENKYETQTKDGITLTKNEDGTITLNGSCSSSEIYNDFNLIDLFSYSGEKIASVEVISGSATGLIEWQLTDNNWGNVLFMGIQNNINPNSQQFAEGITYTRSTLRVANNCVCNNLKFGLQIQNGTEVKPYEPYSNGIPSPSPDYEQPINSIEGSVEFACNDNKGSSNQVTFDLGEEKLRSVGDVKDELVVDLETGDYFKIENIKELAVLSEEITRNSITEEIIQILTKEIDIMKNIEPTKQGNYLISNYISIDRNQLNSFSGTTNTNKIRINLDINKFSSLSSVKEWLQSNNVLIDYVTIKPTTKKLGTLSTEDLAKLSTFDGYNNLFINTNLGYMNIRVTYSTNTNYNENIILGDDSYYYGVVDNKQSLPEGKAKGTLCQTKDTKDFYIYNGEEWIPVDKTASFDLSNYLSKDNTTPYSPSDRYNPATKQYVDTNIQGLRIPTKVSQLENDSNYITENTNTLVNYYNKNNTYNKKEVDALIDSSGITPVSVTLNGQKTTDANFYAPASGGTANQILVSQGDTAPVWQNNTAVQTVNQDIKLVISDIQPEAPSSGFILWVDSTK